MSPAWHVYMVRCRDGTLYTGIATDVERRLAEHADPGGRGARYLRGRAPLTLVFSRPAGPREIALRLEYRIKRLPRARKEALLRNPELASALLDTPDGRPASD